MLAKAVVLTLPAALLINPHQCNSLTQGPRCRRAFVVDSVASIASVSIGASFPGISVARDEVAPASQLALPPIGIGAWAWGDNIFWGYDKKVRC